MKTKFGLLVCTGLLLTILAARAGTDMVSAHDYETSARAWQPPPPPEDGYADAPAPPPAAYYPPPPAYYPPPYAYGPDGYYGGPGLYGPAFYGPAIGIGFHIR
jgi:hypothetical protein